MWFWEICVDNDVTAFFAAVPDVNKVTDAAVLLLMAHLKETGD